MIQLFIMSGSGGRVGDGGGGDKVETVRCIVKDKNIQENSWRLDTHTHTYRNTHKITHKKQPLPFSR